jgi:tRNA(Ile)-lysidine synthetase-like protein
MSEVLESSQDLGSAVATVPAGRWAVGVSGGADSVALLSLLRRRGDLSLVVAHLDHQTREGESAADAAFVAGLSARWNLPCSVRQRDEVEVTVARPLTANRSSRFRAARFAMFRQVAAERDLQGVILAHHADDQAETVLHRLLRGARASGLAGMSKRATVGGLTVLRPLLRVPGEVLRRHLLQEGQDWREDASNRSPEYLRNRLRRVLERHVRLRREMLLLAEACAGLRAWIQAQAPRLAEQFATAEVADLPGPLHSEALRRWLAERGLPSDAITPAVVARLSAMVLDAATAARQHFPGGLVVHRRRGLIECIRAS